VAAVKRKKAGGTTEVDLLTVYDSVDIAEVASHVRALGGVWVGNIEEGLRDFDIVIHLPYTPGGNIAAVRFSRLSEISNPLACTNGLSYMH
jgi:hypothetical protein